MECIVLCFIFFQPGHNHIHWSVNIMFPFLYSELYISVEYDWSVNIMFPLLYPEVYISVLVSKFSEYFDILFTGTCYS